MKLNQVTLPVADIVRSRAFYLKLGFALIVDEDHYCRFEAPAGAGTLSIERDAKHAPGKTASGAILYFEYESPGALDAGVASLAAEGIAFNTPPTDQSWLWREARLADPDGHRLVLYFAGPNRLDPPWRVGRK